MSPIILGPAAHGYDYYSVANGLAALQVQGGRWWWRRCFVGLACGRPQGIRLRHRLGRLRPRPVPSSPDTAATIYVQAYDRGRLPAAAPAPRPGLAPYRARTGPAAYAAPAQARGRGGDGPRGRATQHAAVVPQRTFYFLHSTLARPLPRLLQLQQLMSHVCHVSAATITSSLPFRRTKTLTPCNAGINLPSTTCPLSALNTTARSVQSEGPTRFRRGGVNNRALAEGTKILTNMATFHILFKWNGISETSSCSTKVTDKKLKKKMNTNGKDYTPKPLVEGEPVSLDETVPPVEAIFGGLSVSGISSLFMGSGGLKSKIQASTAFGGSRDLSISQMVETSLHDPAELLKVDSKFSLVEPKEKVPSQFLLPKFPYLKSPPVPKKLLVPLTETPTLFHFELRSSTEPTGSAPGAEVKQINERYLRRLEEAKNSVTKKSSDMETQTPVIFMRNQKTLAQRCERSNNEANVTTYDIYKTHKLLKKMKKSWASAKIVQDPMKMKLKKKDKDKEDGGYNESLTSEGGPSGESSFVSAKTIFLTCGADFCIRIWQDGIGDPLFSLSLTGSRDPVLDATWSPVNANIIASISGSQIHIWDISRKISAPVSTTDSPTPITPTPRLSTVRFEKSGRNLVVGDIRGRIHLFALKEMPFSPFFQEEALVRSVTKALATRPDLYKELRKNYPLFEELAETKKYNSRLNEEHVR
ncbi:Cytoplasmic dynein 1 intermediate chain [Gryllus bimaculatus]|nr:Cytoplasmic dynein 1 intermediate chain [Gryllus bimaculatus]